MHIIRNYFTDVDSWIM